MAESTKEARPAPRVAAPAQAVDNGSSRHEQLEQRPAAQAVNDHREVLAGRQSGSSRPRQPEAAPANRTGLPGRLKAGVESLSGLSLDGVRVHLNSSRPAALGAAAYAQGSDIHVAPGQERHLPHEAWHVVQQAQGRVMPTRQLKGGISVNDDLGLEREADTMGEQALRIHAPLSTESRRPAPAMRIAAQRMTVTQLQLNDDDARAVHEHYVLNHAHRVSWEIWQKHEAAIVREGEDLNAALQAVDAQIAPLAVQQAESYVDLSKTATELIGQKKTGDIEELLAQVQRRRAAKDPVAAGAEGREAELLCLRYLATDKQQPDEQSHSSKAQTIKSPDGPIATISPAFREALALCKQRGRDVWGESEESLVLQAVREATSNLLFFLYSQTDVHYPPPENLNSIGDLQRFRAMILQHALDTLKPDQDDIDHAVGRAGPQAGQIGPSPEYLEAIGQRLNIRAQKRADMWLKVASPYVALKTAFLDGWEEHEHGSLERRGLYYLLTREPGRAKAQIAGNEDQQAGIVEPISGKVALTIALKEAFDFAACHEDAIEFAKFLGARTFAKGSLHEREGGETLLPALQASLLRQLHASHAPIVGLRLRDSNHHSLVLLFELVDKAGLMGTLFETVAGRNTDRILYFMDSLQPLKAADQLIASSLPKALLRSKQGWILEWEVFEVPEAKALGRNLEERVSGSIEGVQQGLETHAKNAAASLEYTWYEDGIPPWLTGADKYTDMLAQDKPRHLEEKQKNRLQLENELALEEERRDALRQRYEGELALVTNDDALCAAKLTQILNDLGQNAMISIARTAGLGFERVLRLLPEL